MFGFGKKKETPSSPQQEVISKVKVLGGGCDKCNQLEAAAVEALKELGMDPAIEHVRDFSVIATYGVMTTPALVLGDKVVSTGKVLKKEDVMKILQENPM